LRVRHIQGTPEWTKREEGASSYSIARAWQRRRSSAATPTDLLPAARLEVGFPAATPTRLMRILGKLEKKYCGHLPCPRWIVVLEKNPVKIIEHIDIILSHSAIQTPPVTATVSIAFSFGLG